MLERKPTRYYSKKQENKVAKAIGGKRTPNSGATPYIKGDVTVGGSTGANDNAWLLECKTKTSNAESFAIKKKWLTDIKAEAISQGKMNYAVVFNYGPNQPNYYILDEKVFLALSTAEEE